MVCRVLSRFHSVPVFSSFFFFRGERGYVLRCSHGFLECVGWLSSRTHAVSRMREYRIEDRGYRIQNTGYRIQNTEYRIRTLQTPWHGHVPSIIAILLFIRVQPLPTRLASTEKHSSVSKTCNTRWRSEREQSRTLLARRTGSAWGMVCVTRLQPRR